MTNRKSFTAALAALPLALALACPVALAAGGHGSHDRTPAHELIVQNLSDAGVGAETQLVISELVDSYSPELDALKTQLDALRPSQGEEPSDTEREQVDALREEMHTLSQELMDAVQAELTDDQWTALSEALPPPPGQGGRGGHHRGMSDDVQQ